MNGSIKIGTLFGIPIRLHWSFLILMVIFAQIGELFGFMALFGSVLLHELGHSLMARRFQIRVLDISFWPLGGMARMSEIPESPRVEGLVAIAGPLVNFVLAAMGAAVGLALAVFTVGTGGEAGTSTAVGETVVMFTLINLLLGTFNLVPAFPMDGGRLLRAWFGRSMDWVRATERAVSVGRVVAAGMLLLSLVLTLFSPATFCGVPLIALFVWVAGGKELMAVRVRHGQSPFGAPVVGTNPFQRPTPAAEAEVVHTAAEVEVEHPTDPSGAQRPETWRPRPSGGFSDEDVRELERFHGRLRRPSEDDDG